jgi:autophagy-related protein 18
MSGTSGASGAGANTVHYTTSAASAASVTSGGSSVNVNYITFNQNLTLLAIGLPNGYKIFSLHPFGPCFFHHTPSVGIISLLYTTSLIALVSLGDEPGQSPRKLKIINTSRQSTICDLIFPSTILQVKLTKQNLIVLLEEQIYIYDITTMKLLHTIETSPNVNGLCTISDTSLLAYPSPPKTITHDSLLVTGINTNGGSNSAQNNIQSVSNSPNRVGDVIIFNLTTLQPMLVIEAHKSSLAAITLSNDGSLLATASDKGTIVRVFAVDSGVKLYQFRRGTYPTKIYSLAFSSGNRYVLATSSSETVHIFRLGEDEALENKHRLKRLGKRKVNLIIEEEGEEQAIRREHVENAGEGDDNEAREHGKLTEGKPQNEDDSLTPKLAASDDQVGREDEEIRDDGDDSDAVDDEDDEDEEDEVLEMISKQRKLSLGSYASVNSGISIISNEEIPSFSTMSSSPTTKTEPIIDQTRLSVARLIRRSSQTLGRKAAQKMGDFLPSRFSSILEPTRHFASLKINSIGKDVKSIAVMSDNPEFDLLRATVSKDSMSSQSSSHSVESLRESTNLLHINVVTSEGVFYTYGLDPERGGDCILLRQYGMLDD